MKAVVYTRYGPPEVLQIRDVAKPVPAATEILIQVYAATVNRTDCGYRSAKYFVSRFFTGLVKPKRAVAGSEFAGKVVGIGANVTDLKVGDRVFGFDDLRGAAHAEYMTEAASGPFTTIPDGCSYEQVAPAAEGATYAINVIRAVRIRKGQRALVYGASGAIGSAAVQILRHLGVSITAVCDTNSVALVEKLGADRVISFETEDFTQLPERFDFIFDAVGKSSYGTCTKLLAPHGTYYSTELGRGFQNPLLAIWFTITRSRRVIFPIPKIDKEKIEYIKQLLESGEYTPVIDRTYPLDEIVEAVRYVETGQKIGNVVLRVAPSD
jgi:NADPH:quinone reductase-like Zn-dependent oxidoreductase